MTTVLKVIFLNFASIISVSCQECFTTCVYDMLDLKNKINEIKTCGDDLKELKEEVEVLKNKTKGI